MVHMRFGYKVYNVIVVIETMEFQRVLYNYLWCKKPSRVNKCAENICTKWFLLKNIIVALNIGKQSTPIGFNLVYTPYYYEIDTF